MRKTAALQKPILCLQKMFKQSLNVEKDIFYTNLPFKASTNCRINSLFSESASPKQTTSAKTFSFFSFFASLNNWRQILENEDRKQLWSLSQ